MKIDKRVSLLIALGMVAGAVPAQAAYIVERGAGAAVCNEYRDHLNAGGSRLPYHTERPITSTSGRFKGAEWTAVPDGSRFPADEIIQFFWKRDANPAWYLVYPQQWIDWRGAPEQIQRAKDNFIEQVGREETGYAQGVSFRVSHLDIDNDGQPEPIVQFSTNSGLGKMLIVLTRKGTEIDHKKSRLVLRHPAWGDKAVSAFRKAEPGKPVNPAFEHAGLEPVEDALSRATYGVFAFEERTYFDLWWLKEPSHTRAAAPSLGQWRLRVYWADRAQVKEVCTLRFATQPT